MSKSFYVQNETARRQVISLAKGGSITLLPKGIGSRDVALINEDNADDRIIAALIDKGMLSRVSGSGATKKRTEAVSEREAKVAESKATIESIIEKPVDAIVQVVCAGVKADGTPCKAKVSVLESEAAEPAFCARHADQKGAQPVEAQVAEEPTEAVVEATEAVVEATEE